MNNTWILVICFAFLVGLISQVSTYLLNYYDVFLISETHEEFDLILGNIIREEKVLYRKHKKSGRWQRGKQVFGIKKSFFQRSRVTVIKCIWKDEPISAWKELEEITQPKPYEY